MNVPTQTSLTAAITATLANSEAKTAFETLGLPGSKTEEYRFTPVTRILEKSFSQWPSSNVAHTVKNIDAYKVPGYDTDVVALVNGRFAPALSNVGKDISIHSLAEASNNPIFKSIFGKQADLSKDPFIALNSAANEEGLFISVAENVEASKPLMILQINDSSNAAVAAHNRLVISVGRKAILSLIENTITIGDQPVFHTLVEEILVEDEGKLEYIRLQNDKKSVAVIATNIRQLEKSHVNTYTLTLDGKLVRNNLSISIDGEFCESHFHGLYLLNGDTIADNHTVVDHRKPNSFSNELYKGVMDDNSKGVFNGKIFVRPHAQKTNAFQSNRNILLTDRATINTKPQLEIWADDVKCSHGCTSGQLDDEALFYLQSRGIAKEAARALLLDAFASQTLELITNEALKGHLSKLITDRLYQRAI